LHSPIPIEDVLVWEEKKKKKKEDLTKSLRHVQSSKEEVQPLGKDKLRLVSSTSLRNLADQ
jgi:hypothetical protein